MMRMRMNKLFRATLIGGSIFVFGITLFYTTESQVYDSGCDITISDENISLWRANPSTEAFFSRSNRIEKQRMWIKEFSRKPPVGSRKTKRILIADNWEYFYGARNLTCPYAPGFESRCHFVLDKPMYPFLQEWEHFDAIVGTRHWEYRLYENLLPKSMRQFLFVLEPPYVAIPIDLSRNNAILGSYLQGSDIPIPYYSWNAYDTSRDENTASMKNFAENKTKLVAAAISNCDNYNGRIDYVRELQKHIQVDFYGECGNLTCPQDCFKSLGKEYKFFLSFENSNCRNYITEKFFRNALMNNMVPVALGAHFLDYKSLAPKNSYIHVDEFSNPKDLASYLEKLNKDDELYNKYFAWKGTGELSDDPVSDFFCRVCGLLFYSDFHPFPEWEKKTYWKDVNQCLEPHKWYWNRNQD